MEVVLIQGNTKSAAPAGSATVSWTDGNGNHIRNFHADINGYLIMTQWDDGVNIWISYRFDYVINNVAESAIAAVSINPGTVDHAIHLFVTIGDQKLMQSLIWSEQSRTYKLDDDFNALGVTDYTPRAAIGWTDPNTGSTEICLWYIQLIEVRAGDNYKYASCVCAMWQINFTGGGWQAPVQNYSYSQYGGMFSDSLAAVTWMSDGTRQIRLYYHDIGDIFTFFGDLAELSWDDNTKTWTRTQSWEPDNDEYLTKFRTSAVQYTGLQGTRQIRVYKHIEHHNSDFTRNVIREWSYDDGSRKWIDRNLPFDILKNTHGRSQQSSVAWTSDGEVQIRLYQWHDSGSSQGAIAETVFSTSTGWVANDQTFM